MLKNISIYLLLIGLSGCSVVAAQSEPHLIPWPKSVKLESGNLQLTPSTNIVAGDPKLSPLADLLSHELLLATGDHYAATTGEAKSGDIVLQLDPQLNGETSSLEINDRVIARGGNYQAVAEATASMLQLLDTGHGAVNLPHISISDAPAVGFRALQVCIKHRPNSIDVLHQSIEICRLYKIRYFMVHLSNHQWWMILSKSFRDNPTQHIGREDGNDLTPDEMRDLIQYARVRGVTMFPQIEACNLYSMPEQIQRAMPDIFTPEVQARIKGKLMQDQPEFWQAADKTIGEIADLFGESPYIHLGPMDGEVAAFGQDDLERAYMKKVGLKTSGDYWRYLFERFDEIVKKHGRTSMAWEGVGPDDDSNFKIPSDAIIEQYNDGFNPVNLEIRHGLHIVNCAAIPLYVVMNTQKLFGAKEIYNWNMDQFGGTGMSTKLYQQTQWIDVPPTPLILGAQLSTWEQPEIAQLFPIRTRIPAMSERVWNPDAGKTYQDFQSRFAATDQLVERLIDPAQVHVDGLTPLTRMDVYNQRNWFGDTATITMRPMVSGGSVHYTTNNTEPTIASPLYSSPIELKQDTVFMARLFDADGKPVGDHFLAHYEFHPISVTEEGLTDAMPTDWRPNLFQDELKLTFKCLLKGGEIRYTLDGSAPTAHSPVYSEPLKIDQTTQVKAIAFDDKGEPRGEHFSCHYDNLGFVRSLTTGQKVTASSGTIPGTAENAVSGMVNHESYWDAAPAPQWLMVTLKEPAKINKIQMFNYWDGSRYYQYIIEVSMDGKQWQQVVDMTHNTTPATKSGTIHQFPAVNARYIRVTMLKNSANPGVHIVELRAFAESEADH